MALKYENKHPEEEDKEQLYKENGYANRTFNLDLTGQNKYVDDTN